MYIAGARYSNYSAWLDQPTLIGPGAQPIPRTVPAIPSIVQDAANGDVGGGFAAIQVTSGLFQVWRAQGFTSTSQLFVTGTMALVMCCALIWAGWFHYHRAVPNLGWFSDVDSALNHHLAGLFGLGSLAWAGHIIHVAYPTQALLSIGVDPRVVPTPQVLASSSHWLTLLNGPGFTLRNLFCLNWAALGSGLTTIGGNDPLTSSLWLSDIAHHHLAIGVLFILAGHLYKTDFGLGVSMSEILASHQLEVFNSWHLQLALQLALQGSVSVWFGHLLIALPAYPFLVTDYATVLSLFTHHQWIGGFFIVGGAAHASMALIFDCNLRAHPFISLLIAHKNAIIVHLNWVCIFIGFHSFGLYIHNDTVAALGRSVDQFSDQAIVLAPVFARWIQSQWIEPSVSVMGIRAAGRVFGLGTADTLVHHVHAFTIHVTASVASHPVRCLLAALGWYRTKQTSASGSPVMDLDAVALVKYLRGIISSWAYSGCTTLFLSSFSTAVGSSSRMSGLQKLSAPVYVN